MPSYGGVIANSYLPSNWLSALGLYAWAQVDESSDNKSLINPAKKFTYVAPEGLDDTYVVFIIGETTRWDHMGILGYSRNTTPELEKEKNLVAFRGYSCDTATKLSLRCMFVRQGGAEDNPQRTLKEQNVFAVLHQLASAAICTPCRVRCGSTATRWPTISPIASRLAPSRATAARALTICCWWMR